MHKVEKMDVKKRINDLSALNVANHLTLKEDINNIYKMHDWAINKIKIHDRLSLITSGALIILLSFSLISSLAGW